MSVLYYSLLDAHQLSATKEDVKIFSSPLVAPVSLRFFTRWCTQLVFYTSKAERIAMTLLRLDTKILDLVRNYSQNEIFDYFMASVFGWFDRTRGNVAPVVTALFICSCAVRRISFEISFFSSFTKEISQGEHECMNLQPYSKASLIV